jgi:TolB-like protein
MGEDEAGTRARFNAHLHDLIEPAIAGRMGRTVKTMGDGLLVEFASVVDAVQCAADIQKGMAERNAGEPEDRRIDFRIGVNLGDVIIEGDDIHGDGVNVAARLEALADPGGVAVSGTVHEHVHGKLDLEFTDLGDCRVKNIARSIRVFRASVGGDAATATDAPVPAPVPEPSDIPAIAVLPFDSFSGDPEQDYFADGVTEDVITELARWKEFSVIARNSSFTYKGKPVKVQQVAEDLGVRYVLEGSVRQGGDRIRITAQLIDAETGHHVWADRFDESGEDVLALQDAVTDKIVDTLGGDLGEIRRGEYGRAWSKPAASLEEYDYFLRGHQVFYGFTKEAMARAHEIWLEGLEHFPNSGLLRVKVGWVHVLSAIFGWAEQPMDALAQSFALVDEGLSDPALPPAGQRYGLWLRATLYLWLKRDVDKALREARATIDLFPYDGETFAVLAPIPAYAGDPALGEEWMRIGLANEPNPPMIYNLHLGKVLYMTGKFDQARDALLRIDPPNFDMLRYLAASCVGLGELDAARSAVKQILEIAPPLTLTQLRAMLPYREEAHRERELTHLRAAGMLA